MSIFGNHVPYGVIYVGQMEQQTIAIVAQAIIPITL
jgi:hypothetical protein